MAEVNGGSFVRVAPIAPDDINPDMDVFLKQYKRVEAWLKNFDEPPAEEHLQSPAERAKLDGLYECILCACCSGNCPSFWWNHGDPNRFIGPAGLLAINRFILDSRDMATHERLEQLNDLYSLFACRTIMNCVPVCPKNLNPAKAIREIRSKILSGKD